LRSRQNSFKEHNKFTILTMLLDPLFSHIKDSLTNFQFFSHLLACSDFAQSLCSSPMKSLGRRVYFLKVYTQFSILNTLLNHLASNINGFLRKAQCFSIHLKGLFCKNLQTEFTILTMLLDPLVPNIKDSLTKAAVFLPFILCGDFAQSLCFSPMKKLKVRQRSS
jgi:hypothetical protein